MSPQLVQLQEATIKQYCKALRMPMIGMQFSSLAEQAVKCLCRYKTPATLPVLPIHSDVSLGGDAVGTLQ